jgi:hypothetical protein
MLFVVLVSAVGWFAVVVVVITACHAAAGADASELLAAPSPACGLSAAIAARKDSCTARRERSSSALQEVACSKLPQPSCAGIPIRGVRAHLSLAERGQGDVAWGSMRTHRAYQPHKEKEDD